MRKETLNMLNDVKNRITQAAFDEAMREHVAVALCLVGLILLGVL